MLVLMALFSTVITSPALRHWLPLVADESLRDSSARLISGDKPGKAGS
jgi:hypothetical protein